MSTLCKCMDGPNDPDPACLYCGGTGEFVSDERLAELVERYGYLVANADTIGRRDFATSDRQHVAIFKALQVARGAADRDAAIGSALAAKLVETHRP